MPIAGIIPDVVHHIDVLPGNDTISGNGGDDFIVADNANAYSPLITGFETVEQNSNVIRVAEHTQASLERAMHSLGALSVDYLQSVNGTPNIEHDVEVAGDVVFGGSGNDQIHADDAMIVADAIKGIPTTNEDLSEAAHSVQNYLNDIEHVATDFEYVTFEAHYHVLDTLRDTGPATATNDMHDLYIGNDEVEGGDGDDVITGDHAAILTSIADGQAFDSNSISSQFDATTWNDVSNSLHSAASNHQSQLANHAAAHHNQLNRSFTTAEINSMPEDFEFDRWIGDDKIDGDAGADLIIGDFGAYAFPILDTAPITVDEQQQANENVDELTSGWTDWLQQQSHETSYTVRVTGTTNAQFEPEFYDHPLYEQRGTSPQWVTSAGNDEIAGGDGGDYVLGDSMSISTNLIADDLASRFSEGVSEFRVTTFDRIQFELTDHFTRSSSNGPSSVFGEDVIDGGTGDDTLFGQFQTDTIEGGIGLDRTFGGEGSNNVSDPDSEPNAGGKPIPQGDLLEDLEDFRFERLSMLNSELVSDISGPLGSELNFELQLGNFVASDADVASLAVGSTSLLVMP